MEFPKADRETEEAQSTETLTSALSNVCSTPLPKVVSLIGSHILAQRTEFCE